MEFVRNQIRNVVDAKPITAAGVAALAGVIVERGALFFFF